MNTVKTGNNSSSNTDGPIYSGTVTYVTTAISGATLDFIVQRKGDFVFLWASGVAQGTTTSSNVFLSDVFIPQELRPSAEQNYVPWGRNSAIFQDVRMSVNSSGDIFYSRIDGSAFSGPGSLMVVRPTSVFWPYVGS